jgi:hypothetical protein
MASNRKMTWHVVTSQGRIVLGVYGEALLSHAQRQAAEVERSTGLPAFVEQVRATWARRPFVGACI